MPSKKHLQIIVFLFLAHCQDPLPLTESLRKKSEIPPPSTHIFVNGHADDWMLFMGEYAYEAISSPDNQVVIIILTAGDAGRDETFWRGRETGSLASVRAVLDYPIHQGDPSEKDEMMELSGKKLRWHETGNVHTYFLRLPDGYPNGQGSKTHGGQSLYKMEEGKLPSITTVDENDTYTLSDVENVLQDIFTKEHHKDSIYVHLLDPVGPPDFSHSDHYMAQKLATQALAKMDFQNCKILSFEDYRIQNKTPNLSGSPYAQKTTIFAAYDFAMFKAVGECKLCSSGYLAWLARSYHKEFSCHGSVL